MRILFVAKSASEFVKSEEARQMKALRLEGHETTLAAANDFTNPNYCQIPYCDHYFDLNPNEAAEKLSELICGKKYGKIIWQEGLAKAEGM